MKKTQEVSHIDKGILRVMLRYGCAKGRWLSTNEVSRYSEVNWKTANLHLQKLYKLNFVVNRIVGKRRDYTRTYGKKGGSKKQSIIDYVKPTPLSQEIKEEEPYDREIKSERKIEWTLKVKENPELQKMKKEI